jgi:hypothetical protein
MRNFKNVSKALTSGAILTLGLLLALGGAAKPALAGTSGGIAGVVTDAQTGAPLSGVDLRISSPSQTVTTTTDTHGHYIVFNLQPDDYTITAVKSGYATQSFAGDSVYADQTQRYDLILSPASSAPPQ